MLSFVKEKLWRYQLRRTVNPIRRRFCYEISLCAIAAEIDRSTMNCLFALLQRFHPLVNYKMLGIPPVCLSTVKGVHFANLPTLLFILSGILTFLACDQREM